MTRYDAVIGNYLGETPARLARVLRHARTRQSPRSQGSCRLG